MMKNAQTTLAAIALCIAAPGWAGAQNQQQPPPRMQMPGDMRMPPNKQQNDPAAAKESESIQNSENQQRPQTGVKPTAGADAQSLTHSTLMLQEPENPAYRTGKNLPAPELLNEITKREPLSLGDFEDWAKNLNPTLAQTRAFVQRSKDQARQAGLYPNPTVAYDGEHIRGGSYGAGEQGAYVQQVVVLGGKLHLRREIHERQADVNNVGVEEQSYRIRADVEQAFYRALSSQAEVVVRQRLLKLAEDAVETAHQLGNVGQADAPDILQSEVEAEQAQVDFLRAQRRYLRGFTQLAALAGKPDLSLSPLRGDLEHPSKINAEQQVTNIVANSPEVKRARQEVEVAEARLRDARRESVPDVTLRAGEWWSGEITEGTHHAAGPMSFASAGIDLPLWNRNQGNIAAAKAELERAQQNVARVQLSLKNQAEPVAQEYDTACFEADRYRTEMIPRAQRAYQLYMMKYQQMATAYPQVLVSQRTLFQLQIDYLRALGNVWRSSITLQNYGLRGELEMPQASGNESTTINLPNGGGSQ